MEMVKNLLVFFGGIGMFIYGMKVMGDGLEKAAGNKLQTIVDKLTGKRWMGVLIGTAITAIIQSSSATTVMVVGFVNSGIMKLTQAVGVIMGANIGTTVTAQILRLGDISSNAWYMAIFKPTTIAPIAMVIGAGLLLFSGSKNRKSAVTGEILSGLALLFIGMQQMEAGVAFLKTMPAFEAAFVAFGQNPFLGVLVGTLVTALIQSSSASVGILQAAAANGLVTCSSAIPIIMGQNIGTCITAILSSVGANKNAKRAAVIHLLFNLVGTVVLMAVIYLVHWTIDLVFWNDVVDRGWIANFHSIFNIVNTVMLYPFANGLVWMAEKLIKGDDSKVVHTNLDERFLTTPGVAAAQTVREVAEMARLSEQNFRLTAKAVLEGDFSVAKQIDDTETMIDELEVEITNYLTKLVEQPLAEEENRIATGLFHTVNDVERIGDHAQNIKDMLLKAQQNNWTFSDSAKKELAILYNCCYEIIELAVDAFEKSDVEKAYRVESLEQVVDLLIDQLKDKHIGRLSNQQCNVHSGVLFLELLGNFERISDHCSNIGVSVLQQVGLVNDNDTHRYTHEAHDVIRADKDAVYREYVQKYSLD